MLNTKEHYDLIEQFEQDFRVHGRCREKENKSLWSKGNIFTHGATNELFLAYRRGYAFGKSVFNQPESDCDVQHDLPNRSGSLGSASQSASSGDHMLSGNHDSDQ